MSEDFKTQAVADLVDLARAKTGGGNYDRADLEEILEGLRRLAGRSELWSSDKYPFESETELQEIHTIHQEPDGSYALYLAVMRPGLAVAPHDHTTWACVASVEGEEVNYLYERTDDGSVSGRASLRLRETIIVDETRGIALMPSDIHSIASPSSGEARHLHMYGLALDKLEERTWFDVEHGTCRRQRVAD